MKRSLIVGGLGAVVALGGWISTATAEQDEKKGKDKDAVAPCKHDHKDNHKHEHEAAAPSYDEMMEIWAQMNAPGEEHARFKECVGKWKTETKMWMGPGKPMVFEGVSEVSLVFGGRYLREHYRCTSPEMPFEGVALVGYDTIKKEFVSIWYDSMSTGIMLTRGTRDEATKTTTMLSAEYDDPFKGRGKVKNVIYELTKDTQRMEMYWIGADGKEFKEMEIAYTRVTPGEKG